AGTGADGLAGVTALCLSAAVAAEIRDLGWRAIATAETPDRKGMLALIAREKENGEPVMSEDKNAAPSEAADTAGAAADPARGAAIIAAAPTPQKSGRAGAALLGLVAGAVAGGGVVLAEPYWRPYVVPAETENTGGDTSALAAEIAALKEQLAAIGTEQDV